MPAEQLLREYGLDSAPEVTARYNVAPSQEIVAVRASSDGARQAALLRWGLVPHWAKEPTIGNRMINARGETVAEKPAYRQAFRHRRCIIPASGFYEWGPSPAGKWPYFLSATEAPLLSLAGLWERWQGAGGQTLESCTIITLPASPAVARLHNRMPVCLPASAYSAWLDPATPADACLELLAADAGPTLAIRPVSKAVNNPRNDGPGLVETVEPAAR